jgi:serine/threonine protein kinase
MNYCPFGSMHKANPGLQERPAARKGKKANNKPLDINDDGRELPESLIWKWFEDLAKACVLMEKGKDHPSGLTSRLSGQHTIVHRDIKPPNIFLDLPSTEDGEWPGYPVATLGDFGRSSLVPTVLKQHLLTILQAQQSTLTMRTRTTQCPTATAKGRRALDPWNCAQ